MSDIKWISWYDEDDIKWWYDKLRELKKLPVGMSFAEFRKDWIRTGRVIEQAHKEGKI